MKTCTFLIFIWLCFAFLHNSKYSIDWWWTYDIVFLFFFFFFGLGLKCCLLLQMRIYYWSCFNICVESFMCHWSRNPLISAWNGFPFNESFVYLFSWSYSVLRLFISIFGIFICVLIFGHAFGVYFDCLVCTLLWLREEGYALVCGYRFISPVKNLFDVYEKRNTFKMECNHIRGYNEWRCMEIIWTL